MFIELLKRLRNFLYGVLTGALLCGLAMHGNPRWVSAISLVNSACAVAMLTVGVICFLHDRKRWNKDMQEIGEELRKQTTTFRDEITLPHRHSRRGQAH